MNEALFTASPLSPSRSNTAARTGQRSLFFLFGVAGLLMLAINLFHRESYSGDEGFYGVTAQNMLQSPTYLLRPSYYPAGDFVADRGGYAHPPFNSYLYALSLWLSKGSLIGPDVLNALSFLALLFFSYQLLALFDRQTGRFAALLLAASPAMVASFSFLEAEPLMTTFGVIALYCCTRGGFPPNRKKWFLMGGLSLGFSFALKLWLCGPLVLAVVAALLVRALQPKLALRDRVVPTLLVVLGGIIPAALHLGAIAWFYPQDVSFWLREIYFGIFTSAGISGSKFAGASIPAAWIHPIWYYGAAIYRDHFIVFPIILFGARSLLLDARLRKQLLPIVLAGALGVVPLSLMKVKEPLYVLSCCVFLYFLAGACLAALARRLAATGRIDDVSLKLGTVATLGLLLLFPAAYAAHLKPDDITRGFVIGHTLALSALLTAVFWSHRKKSSALLGGTTYAACAIAVVAAFTCNAVTRRPRDEVIARVARPYIQANAPGALSMIASNFKAYQFQTFRRGCYWHELPLDAPADILLASEPFATVRVFILSPEDQRKPEIAPWLHWIEGHALEKTREVDEQLGAVSGFRLFVRNTSS
jgi:4-amino-4-deoxy-L-arabinose transferase-like glycosyltransferase